MRRFSTLIHMAVERLPPLSGLAEAIKTLKEVKSDARRVKWLLALTLMTLLAAIIAKLIIR